jgi:hypothetical protein
MAATLRSIHAQAPAGRDFMPLKSSLYLPER